MVIIMSGIITLTTDFGDVYPSIMKGVIKSIDRSIDIVDITNSVRQGNIMHGAFALRFASSYFPPGTVHLAVVDPGVGSERRALVIRGERFTFVGPDNGLLMPAARAQGRFDVFEITDLRFYTSNVSPVFHGRDVFAPAAAYSVSGIKIPGLRRVSDPVDLDFGVPRLEDDSISGKVIYVDAFGNVVTNIGGDALSGLCYLGQGLDINGIASTFTRTYYEGSAGDVLVLVGSHGMVEIACNMGNASTLTGLKEGDKVVIHTDKRKVY